MTDDEYDDTIGRELAELDEPAGPPPDNEDQDHEHDDGDGHDHDDNGPSDGSEPATGQTPDPAEETETATATTVPAADDDGDEQTPAEELDPDALLPGEQPSDPVVDFDEDTDQAGEIVLLGQSVQLTKIREACPERFAAAGAWDECEDYLSTGAQYVCVYQPIRLTIGSRYQTPPREEISPDPSYDTFQVIDRYTVLGFENIPQEYIPDAVSGNTKEKIWFNITEKLERIYVFPDQEPYTPPNRTFTAVRAHVAVGDDDTREYDNGQLVGALVALEESQDPSMLTCPARELIEQVRAEDGG